MSGDLIAFLNARLDEDEDYANRAGGHEFTFDSLGQLLVDNGVTISKVASLGAEVSGWHIARHDPARMLRRVAAYRLIIAELTADPQAFGHYGKHVHMLRHSAITFAVKCLAAEFSDHPDYRQEWSL